MVIQAQSTTKSKIQAVFMFSVDGGLCSASGSKKKLTVTTGNIVVGGKVVRLGTLPVNPLLHQQ